jgi:putative ABC transport system permease protein
MKILAMAFRNALRHRRRTLFTLLAMAIGLCCLTVFEGFIASQMHGFRESVIRQGIGHIQISVDAKYFESGEYNPYDYLIPNPEETARKLRAIPGVKYVIPKAGFTAIASFGDKSLPLLVDAYPSDLSCFVTNGESAWAKPLVLGKIVDGRGLADNLTNGLILGRTAAKILRAKAGSVVTVMGVLQGGGLNAMDMVVEGIFDSPGMDKNFGFIPFEAAKDFLGLASPPAFVVILSNTELTGAAYDQILKTALPEGGKPDGVKRWSDLAPFYKQVNGMYEGFLGVIQAILLVITVFVVVNTMTMSVFERMREIGTLRSLGTTRAGIFLLLCTEGLLTGIAGSAAGIVLGFGTSALLNLGGGVPFPYQGETVRILFRPELAALLPGAAAVAFCAFAGAAIPAYRAVHTAVADSLRAV